MAEQRAYHHGDLRRALLDAAVEMIGETGAAGVSLRDLARRAGVSHAAPTHHFKDKTGLFTAVAAEGYRLLADSLAEGAEAVQPEEALRDMGRRYVAFAAAHPAHFSVMFDEPLLRADDPELAEARARAGALLDAAVVRLPAGRRGVDTEGAVLAALSMAHGFATLMLSGGLAGRLGGKEPADRFHDLTYFLFS